MRLKRKTLQQIDICAFFPGWAFLVVGLTGVGWAMACVVIGYGLLLLSYHAWKDGKEMDSET